jgi:hypothetical protein
MGLFRARQAGRIQDPVAACIHGRVQKQRSYQGIPWRSPRGDGPRAARRPGSRTLVPRTVLKKEFELSERHWFHSPHPPVGMGQFRVTPQHRPDPVALDDERPPELLRSGQPPARRLVSCGLARGHRFGSSAARQPATLAGAAGRAPRCRSLEPVRARALRRSAGTADLLARVAICLATWVAIGTSPLPPGQRPDGRWHLSRFRLCETGGPPGCRDRRRKDASSGGGRLGQGARR